MSDEQMQSGLLAQLSKEDLFAELSRAKVELQQFKQNLKDKNERALQIRQQMILVIEALSCQGSHAERNAKALEGIKHALEIMHELYVLTSNVDNIPF